MINKYPEKLTKSQIKKYRIVIFIFLTVSLVAALSLVLQKYIDSIGPQNYPGFVSVQNTDEKQILNLKIEDVHFRIPRNYVDIYSEKGVLLFVLLPDLEPKTEKNNDYFMWDTSPDNRRLSIDINSDENFTSLDDFMMRVYWQGHNLQSMGKRYGLDVKEARSDEPLMILKEFETYSLSENGKIQTFLKCTKMGMAVRPGCNQYFIHKGLLVNVNYNRHYLSDWKKTQDKVTALIDSFIVTESQGRDQNVQFNNRPKK